MKRLLVGLLLCLSVAGCSDESGAVVSGTVTVDGEPATEGFVTFIPVDGMSQSAAGPITNGQYTATNVPVGPAKVEIRVPKITGTTRLYAEDPNSTYPVKNESLPPKYNNETQLEYDVQPGEQTKDFPLTTS